MVDEWRRDAVAALDEVDADLARRQTYRLRLIAGLDTIGHAQDIGAHDTAQLLAFRYRLDPPQARRDLRLALALPKYADVSAALPVIGNPRRTRRTGRRAAEDPREARRATRPTPRTPRGGRVPAARAGRGDRDRAGTRPGHRPGRRPRGRRAAVGQPRPAPVTE